MPHDPYAILHALLRAEAVRNEKAARSERREEPRDRTSRPAPPVRDERE
ncbi:hypothetical protein [Streptomyces boluensis]|uniref:Uncharacterized protein n=1 Tax=Streptomyces boluensis TaxID=1775135 RepID=A0A964XPD3_9ACTN|nr:hypothetical protein [Streptomyces boluensis]NBE56440.1 hypothetical protein [Streptomyces boluensis]